jgi:hypothetical protein
MNRIIKFRLLTFDTLELSAPCAVRIPLGSNLARFFATILFPDFIAPPIFFCNVTEHPIEQLHERDFHNISTCQFLHVLAVHGMPSGFRDRIDLLTQVRNNSNGDAIEEEVRQYLWRETHNLFETPYNVVRVRSVQLSADMVSRPSLKLLGITTATDTQVTFLALDGNDIREFTIALNHSSRVSGDTTSETSEDSYTVNETNAMQATASTRHLPLLRDIAWKEDTFPVKEIRQAVLDDNVLYCLHAVSNQEDWVELKTFERDILLTGSVAFRDTGNRCLSMALPQLYPKFLLERLQMEAPTFSEKLGKSGEILSQISGPPCAFCRIGESDFALLEWNQIDSLGTIHRYHYGKEPIALLSFSCPEKPVAMEWLEQCEVYLVSLQGNILMIDPTYPAQKVPSDITVCFTGAGGDIENFCLAFHGPQGHQNNLLLTCRATRLEAWWLENVT